MDNKKNSDFMFEIKENNNAVEFEDIVSDSKMLGEDGSISLSSFSGQGRFEKKPRGFFAKLRKWWKNRKSWQKASMITAVSVFLVFALAFGIFRIVFNYNYNDITKKPAELGFENVLDENIVNIALFGIDTRTVKSFKGNSDSIMILSLNTITKKVKIISVMRDTLTPITYNGKTSYKKINSAYQRGGPELAIKTLNTIFGLDISEYATVNFYGMADIIEAVGGIEAELTPAEVQSKTANRHAINGCISEICGRLNLNPKEYYIFKSGKQHLNGIQAVAYSRIRYVANIWGTNNDYGRTDRQRYVMEQLFNKALTIDKSKYVKLAKSLIPCSETSLSYKEIMGLAFDILLDSPKFEQTRIPQPEFLMPSPSGVGSVVYYDLDFAAKLIHEFIYTDISPEKFLENNKIEKNDWYPYSNYSGSTTSSTPSNATSSNISSDTDTSSDSSSSQEINSSQITSSEDTSTEPEQPNPDENDGNVGDDGNGNDVNQGGGSEPGQTETPGENPPTTPPDTETPPVENENQNPLQ